MNAELANLVNRSASQVASRRVPRGQQSWSGASIMGGRITIVTIVRNEDGLWSMDDSKSAEFPRVERDQASIRRLHAALSYHFSRTGITELHLRLGAGAGPHNAKAEVHICECALALIPGVHVLHVSPQTLTPWLRAKHQVISCQMVERSRQFALSAAQYAAERALACFDTPAPENRQNSRRRAAIRARIGLGPHLTVS